MLIIQYHLPCNFIYKRARVNEDIKKAKHFINFHARCKDYKEDLSGRYDKKPNNFEPMELKILVKDTRGKESRELATNIPSNRKRQNIDSVEFRNVSTLNLYKTS